MQLLHFTRRFNTVNCETSNKRLTMSNNEVVSPDSLARYLPCFQLHQKDIACVIWFEDALGHYGVPTAVFELYLLVPDIDQAAEFLIQCGWTLLDTKPAQIGITVNKCQRRLAPPGLADSILKAERERKFELSEELLALKNPASSNINAPSDSSKAAVEERDKTRLPPPPPPRRGPPPATVTVLIQASDWNYPILKQQKHHYVHPFPELPKFLDALIEHLLNCSDTSLRNHISTYILYLYRYNPELKEKSFAKRLKREHQQFHMDSLSGMQTWTGLFIEHERKVRDEIRIRSGTYTIQDCSVSPDHDLFKNGNEEVLQLEFNSRMKRIERQYEM
jgi:hypothetical protein